MQYRELHFAGREFTVIMHIALIEALQKEFSPASITPRLSEPSGLLLGRGNEGAAIVSSYAPQPGLTFLQDKEEFWRQFESWLQSRADQLQILGFYRLASDAEPVPKEHDLRVMREFLPESASMLLLIGTSKGNLAGSLFMWEAKDRQRLLASKTKVKFCKGNGIGIAQSRKRTSQSPDRMPRAATRASRWRLVWALAICVAAVPLWHLISVRHSRLPSSQQNSVQQKPGTAVTARVENGHLRVSWDAASSLFVLAKSAALSVVPESGTSDTKVLDRNQLMAGSAVFQLPPGPAKIRLVVFTEEMNLLVPHSNPVMGSPLPAPAAGISSSARLDPSTENLAPPQDILQTKNSPIDMVVPAVRPVIKHQKTDVEPMIIGFKDESWRDRSGQARGGALSGFNPPRPLRLIKPDRYYSLYPFTDDSVQIDVRVRINKFGAVSVAEPLSWGNALLNRLSSIAVRSARESTFVPARLWGDSVPSTALLSYRFLRRK